MFKRFLFLLSLMPAIASAQWEFDPSQIPTIENDKLADMAGYTLKLRNNAVAGDPQDQKVSDLTELVSPGTGDWLVCETTGGILSKCDVGNLPGGGGGLSAADIDTLGELNAIITDADLDDSGDSRPPTAHNHTAAETTSGLFADGRISQSSVQQHVIPSLEGEVDTLTNKTAVVNMRIPVFDPDVTSDDMGYLLITEVGIDNPDISSGVGPPASTPAKLGDIYIDTTVSNEEVYFAIGTASSADWQISQDGAGGGTGDVVGPATANNTNIAIFSGTTGKLIADGGVNVTDMLNRTFHTGTQSASTIGSDTFADARVAASNVTQHVGAIDHDATLNFLADEHIDWTADQGATNIDAGNYIDTNGVYSGSGSLSGAVTVTAASNPFILDGNNDTDFLYLPGSSLININTGTGAETNGISISSSGNNWLFGTADPLSLNGDAGTLNQIITSNGPSLPPTWEDNIVIEDTVYGASWNGDTDAATKNSIYDQIELITAGSGITSLNGETGATQSFADDTNVTISSATDTHTLGWAGTLSIARGGTGAATDVLARSGLGLEIGVDVQAFSTVLENTTASYVVADETKVDHLSVTQAVDLDTIESDTATNNGKLTANTANVTAAGALMDSEVDPDIQTLTIAASSSVSNTNTGDDDTAETDAKVSDDLTHSTGSIALEALTITSILDDEILIGSGVGAASFVALQDCNPTTEKLNWNGTGFTCETDGGGGTVDALSNVATNVLIGRDTAGSGDSEELSPAAARSLLFDGETLTPATIAVDDIIPILDDTDGNLKGVTVTSLTAASSVELRKGISIVNPDAAANDITIDRAGVNITITNCWSHITAGTNVIYNIQHASTRTGTPINVFTSDITETSTAGADHNTGFNDATIPANSPYWLNMVSVAGVVTDFHVTCTYTED